MRGGGGRSICWMEHDGWACWRACPSPHQSHVRGDRGAAGPPAGDSSIFQSPHDLDAKRRSHEPRSLPLPGGCTPGPLHTIVLGYARRGRAEHLSIEHDGWSGGVLARPRTIRNRRGDRGAAGPPAGDSSIFQSPHDLDAKRSDLMNREVRLCPGVAPPDPCTRLPWT